MEDKDLQQLFQSYQPTLSSDWEFMSTLTANMKKMEFIKLQQSVARRQNRIAVVVAAITGFVAGVVFTLLIPYLSAFLSSAAEGLSSAFNIMIDVADPVPVISWIMVGVVTVFLSISSYHLTLSIQGRNI